MFKTDTQGQPNSISRYVSNKYWFVYSILFFLLAASTYLVFTPVTYKVTTRIVLNDGQYPEAALKDIKSKILLKKVVDQLPIQVIYSRKESSGQTELPQDHLPIKCIISKRNQAGPVAEINVTVIDNQQYRILKDRTYMLFFFNQPVDFYSFAKFKIVKGPAFKTPAAPVTVRFYNADQLVKQYEKNFNAKFAGDDRRVIELSLVTNSLTKGKNFLDKLVKVYKGSNNVANIPATPGNSDHNASIEKISNELAALKTKAENFKAQQAALLNNKEAAAAGTKEKESARFLNVLNAIEPYAQRSLNQFALIPDGYTVEDNELKKLIIRFNGLQLDKQHVLQASHGDNLNAEDLNAKIITAGQSILQRIAIDKNKINGMQQPATVNIGNTLPGLEDSISKINNLIKSKQLEYNNLLQNKTEGTAETAAKTKETVIEKFDEHVVTYPKTGYVYLIALLIGLAMPLIIPYFKQVVNFRLMQRFN